MVFKMVGRGELYTLKEASEILGVHSKTIQKWDRKGKIKYKKLKEGVKKN